MLPVLIHQPCQAAGCRLRPAEAFFFAALAVLMFSLNIPLALTIFIAFVLAFLIQFSAFGGKQGQKIWSDLNRFSIFSMFSFIIFCVAPDCPPV